MLGVIINDFHLEIIRENLPTLAEDIIKKDIKKYTKHGIYKPNKENLECVEEMESKGQKVLAIINSSMFYKDIELEVVNYVYISKNYIPANSIKGIKVEALVKNKTWSIESSGIICINEINGNLVRVY